MTGKRKGMMNSKLNELNRSVFSTAKKCVQTKKSTGFPLSLNMPLIELFNVFLHLFLYIISISVVAFCFPAYKIWQHPQDQAI